MCKSGVEALQRWKGKGLIRIGHRKMGKILVAGIVASAQAQNSRTACRGCEQQASKHCGTLSNP